jgi:hypothetical protein
LLVLLVAAPALARPKVAVAPLDSDDGEKVTAVVAEVAKGYTKTTPPSRVAKALDTLSIEKLDTKSLKKLRSNLEVDVIIHGDVHKKHVSLTLSGKGKQKATLELEFKTTKTLKKQLSSQLPKKIEEAAGGGDDDADDDADKKPFADTKGEPARHSKDRSDDDHSKRRADDDDRRRADDDDRRRAEDDDRRRRAEDDDRKRRAEDDDRKRRAEDDDRRRRAEDDDRRRRADDRADDDRSSRRDADDRRARRDDDDRAKKRVADEDDNVRKRSDDDDGRGRKRHRRDDDDDAEHVRNAITQASIYLDAGGAFARRTLTYATTGTAATPPPGVGTAAAAGAIEGEVYPGAFSPRENGSGLGAFGEYTYTFGLGIAVPGANTTAPIKSGHYEVGARYRAVFGNSSIAFGAAYWRRWFIADRTKLMMPSQLDMPDVDYTAVAPGALARFAAAPNIGIELAVDVPLMLDAGPIANGTSLGPANAIAFDVLAGLQIAVAPHYDLQIRGDFDQVGLSFTNKAPTRGVTAATDRSIGLTATLGIHY